MERKKEYIPFTQPTIIHNQFHTLNRPTLLEFLPQIIFPHIKEQIPNIDIRTRWRIKICLSRARTTKSPTTGLRRCRAPSNGIKSIGCRFLDPVGRGLGQFANGTVILALSGTTTAFLAFLS